ncbi:MAG: VIT domain-containing protein [Planctomycetota bacterium]|nr:VIT domain-containing protein [Planctomycetota bacterium]
MLYPGDLLRTSARGAHALEFRTRTGNVLVGPGSELQVREDGIRLLRGELEAGGRDGKAVRIQGPGDFAQDVKGTAWLRTEDRSTRSLEKAPRWVDGYRASASDEWMGSLLAKVDGRDVPLAVGYHKVGVEVRDQIARTTVEQSFINSTKNRLEGVFYFPLPADASISGFGMWIGGELVEADIVERQRARQIYEDILRRKKDPGLLEWEGGNIFKARVFPIEPHSEKRIRIRYTQVLPLEGDTWRYRYALRSELLRSKPLRELEIKVSVVSSRPMRDIGSPTHEITLHNTGTEATAEFRASEYSPKDDFELAVAVERSGDVTAVPHVRGEDGYFMLLVAPPDQADGAWKRELVPEGDPLHVTVVADTSGSMDGAARKNQADFIAALLELLGEKDRFRLLACDATADWLTDGAQAPTAGDAALEALAKRRSLGWTDLDLAVRTALKDAPDGALVIYVGDGVSTTGNADPGEQAERLRAIGQGTKASVHAVAASSSYEAGVLGAMARIGGGSFRTLRSRPAHDAAALLAEAARPTVRDMRVSVEGLRTARVYPAELPNLPLGSQQVVLGRFLPTGKPQQGQVIVTGKLDGKDVRYTADLRIGAGDVGNSFLPRLWGRKHIDALLAGGSGKETQAEIVSFSERFGIMTPYTSFLVLESDEDRERYGVERRVRMRDGERFFAEAKDKAALEKKRDLMRAAGRWRLGLRRQMLLEIARLGRNLPMHTPPGAEFDLEVAVAEHIATFRSDFNGNGVIDAPAVWGDAAEKGLSLGRELARARMPADPAAPPSGGAWDGAMPMEEAEAFQGRAGMPASKAPAPAASPMPSRRARKSEAPSQDGAPEATLDDMDMEELEEELADEPALRPMTRYVQPSGRGGRRGFVGDELLGKRLSYGGPRWRPASFTLQSLGFPGVPKPPQPDRGEPEEPWNDEVLAVLRGLPRREALRALEGPLHIVTSRSELHPTRGTETDRAWIEAWIGKGGWRVKSAGAGFAEPTESWVQDGERGALHAARRLGRERPAKGTDANAFLLPLWDMQSRDVLLAWQRAGWRAKLESNEGGTAVVRLHRDAPNRTAMILTIDTAKRVIRETRHVDAQGRTGGRVVRSDFVEAAGRWWAGSIVRHDRKDRVVSRRTLEVKTLAADGLKTLAQEATKRMKDVLFVRGTLPKRHEAKQAVREKRARFEDHLVLALTLGRQQRWDPAMAAWKDAEGLAGALPGTRWINTEMIARSRRGEQFKTWLMGLPTHLEALRGVRATFLAHYLVRHADQVLGANERLALLDKLASAWKGEGPLAAERGLLFDLRRASTLDAAGRSREARATRTKLAGAWPLHAPVQLAHELDLWNTGRSAEALKLLDELLAKREPWLASERDSLYQRLSDRLWERRELKRLHAAIERWLGHKPETSWIWQRWYSSFYLLGRDSDGDAAVKTALALRPQDGANESVWARQRAAVDLALGSGWHFNLKQLEARWLPALEELLVYLMRLDADHGTSAWTIYGNWRFRRTQAYRRVREAFQSDLTVEGAVASMPLKRLARYIGWLSWGRNQADDALFQTVRAQLTTRWGSADDAATRTAVGNHLITLLDARGLREDAIQFTRERLVYATETKARDRARHARELFDRLLGTPDRNEHATTEREDECFALLAARIDMQDSDETRRVDMARAVRRLADRLYRWRYEAGIGSPEDRKDLSRAAFKTLRRETRKKVRGTLVGRFLKAEEAGLDLAEPWFALERLGFAAEYGEELPAVVDEAARRLSQLTDRKDMPLERLYRERLAATLAYAASRKSATPDTVAAVLGAFARGDEADRARLAKDKEAIELLDWRYQTYRLLVARDDVDTLTATLDDWIVPAKVQSRWRKARGYIHAETGNLPAAIEQFEEVRKLDELAAADYRTLADWYLVRGDDARRADAMQRYYGYQSEWQLSNLAWRLGNTRRRAGGVPGDFDPETLNVLKALFRKARYPGNYWWRQRDLYRATKDHRILASMGEALTGHTREATYGYLGRITQIMGEVHEEATLDEIQTHLERLAAATDSALERRALKLALSLAAGRASLVKEKDPAHGRRALAALKAAFQESWQTGEPLLMARFLRGLGRVADTDVRAEQLRQLEALRTRAEAGTSERLWISDALAQTHWVYGEHERALGVLDAALAEIRTKHEGRVPLDARSAFDRYVNWLVNRSRFADAERYVLAEIERWDLPMRKRGLRRMLYNHYVEAVRRGGSVSLGRGTALFRAAAALMERAMADEPAYAGEILSTFCQLHRRANEVRSPRGAGKLLLAYARERMPALLERLPINATSHFTTVTSTVRSLEGPRTGLSLLLDRHDAEPRWLDRIGYDIWQRAVYNFARWRREAGSIGDLEPRLEKLVLAQLERNLKLGGSHGSYFWNVRNKWSWPQKADAFAATAERVAELDPSSLAVVQRCANLLRHSLRRLRAGTAMLQRAHGRGILDLRARWTLTSWLVADRAFDDALPLAQALVKEKPDNLDYRMKLVAAYAGLKRAEDVASTLDAAEAHFREAKRWRENVAAKLGETAAANRMPERAERWLEEAIRLRQEARGHRGGRDSRLSRYYRGLAKARGELGKTVEAVQAASTAILSANVRNRREFSAAIKSLDEALQSAPSLAAYVETYEAEVAKTGLDAPVLRKALARAFTKRGDHAAAVHHLRTARELEPGDGEVHKALVAAYDELGDQAGAIDALFGSIRLAPHAVDAYRSLAERYAKAGDKAGAERAHTTLVEAAPHQAAGHRALAGVREGQERWVEAAVQWRQVVRTERLDPTGWLALARVLVRTGDAAEAREALDHVMTSDWESRFGDVKAEAAEILRRLKQ